MNARDLSIAPLEPLPLSPSMTADVGRHYLAQIEAMEGLPEPADLHRALRGFCEDEVHHRDDAGNSVTKADGLLARSWAHLVGFGSALGVRIARKV